MSTPGRAAGLQPRAITQESRGATKKQIRPPKTCRVGAIRALQEVVQVYPRPQSDRLGATAATLASPTSRQRALDPNR